MIWVEKYIFLLKEVKFTSKKLKFKDIITFLRAFIINFIFLNFLSKLNKTVKRQTIIINKTIFLKKIKNNCLFLTYCNLLKNITSQMFRTISENKQKIGGKL